jgi:hypothetical protein
VNCIGDLVQDGLFGGPTSIGRCTLTPTSAGVKTLTATYACDPTFNASAGTASHTVGEKTSKLFLPVVKVAK